MEYHPKFKKRIQQTAQAAKWSLFHTGMFLDGITTLNWAGIQIYGGYKRFRPESITAWWICLKLIDPKHEGEIWCGLKNFHRSFLIYVKFNFPLIHVLPPSWLLPGGFIDHCSRWTGSLKILSSKNQSRDMKFEQHVDVPEWHREINVSWHRKIWRTTKDFTCYRHCFSSRKYEIKIGSW